MTPDSPPDEAPTRRRRTTRTFAVALTDHPEGPRLAASVRADGRLDVVMIGEQGGAALASGVPRENLHAALRYLLTATGGRHA